MALTGDITGSILASMSASGGVNGEIAFDGSGTDNYNELDNKPSINGVVLEGNKTSADLHIETGGTDNYNDLLNKPKINGTILTGDVSDTQLLIDYNHLINKPDIPDISEIETRLDTAETDIDNLQSDMSTAEDNIDNINDEIATIKATDLTQNADINSLKNRVTGTETNISNLNTRVSSAETNINNHTTEISSINDDVSGLDTRVGTAEGDIDTLQGDMTQAQSDISELNSSLTQLNGLNVVKRITTPASVVSFSDGSNLPIYKLLSSIEPIQDLHGYDGPWAGGSGKNKLPLTVDSIKHASDKSTWNNNSITINGITYEIQVDTDGNVLGIKTNGTASGDSNLRIYDGDAEFNGKILNGCPSNGSLNAYHLQLSNVTIGSNYDLGNGTVINQTYTGRWLLIINIKSGTTVSNLMFYPMIRLATETDPTFAPYSNICHISGFTETNDTISPTLNTQDGTTYNIDFLDGSTPLTVYGGTLEAITGILTVTKGYIDSYNGEILPSTWISDRDVYAIGTTPTTGAQVVYELASPITYQLSTIQANSLNGNTNIWTDTGDILEVDYTAILNFS